jgi:hypothetical protein
VAVYGKEQNTLDTTTTITNRLTGMIVKPNLRFEHIQFHYEPYPIGYVKEVLPKTYYQSLVEAWPGHDLFEFKSLLGNKYSLSEVNNPKKYIDFVRSSSLWRDFHEYVKSRDFLFETINVLYKHHMDLGLGGQFLSKDRHARTWSDKLKLYKRTRNLSARFEFSMLPANGGFIKPHTDAPGKIITLVLSMMPAGEWPEDFGGGTDVLRPLDVSRSFNFMNKQFDFDQVEVVRSFPFEPNQCVVFIKTFNSWHSVSPLKGANSSTMRKTLTINIEAR